MRKDEIEVLNSAVVLMDKSSEKEINEMFEELVSREEFACVGNGCTGNLYGIK